MVAEDKTDKTLADNYDSVQRMTSAERPARVPNVNRGDVPPPPPPPSACPFHGRHVDQKKSVRWRQDRHRKASEEGEEELMGEMEEPEMSEADEEEFAKPAEPPKKVRHIHPCLCDLSKSQKKRIKAHLDHRALMRRKYNHRIREIEEELARLEEERLEREREMEEQQELFGDEYELVGKKKKRKKRSARRASMVSLGVRQVINWRKQPKIEVKSTKASKLRKEHASYCGRRSLPATPWRHITYGDEPKVKVRVTRAFSMRMKHNHEKRVMLLKQEDKKPRFDLPYYV